MASAVPCWFHSIDLGQGVVTNGFQSRELLADMIERMRLPELRNKSVLDINTWDGFFAFEAECRGAARVVALDHYMWAMDLEQHGTYWTECKERGITPVAYHEMPYYKPLELPGKMGFDTAYTALNSKVEGVVADFMNVDLGQLGMFDVVLYLGSLYHMENPLLALKRVAAVTKEVAIIETEAVAFPRLEQRAICEFFESNELNGDVSNWWAPNQKALTGMCRAAGFSRVDMICGPPLGVTPSSGTAETHITRYRAITHAWK